MTQFDAVWEVIKGWDIERKPGEGYSHATGSDVDAILKAIWEADTALSDLVATDLGSTSSVSNPPKQEPEQNKGANSDTKRRSKIATILTDTHLSPLAKLEAIDEILLDFAKYLRTIDSERLRRKITSEEEAESRADAHKRAKAEIDAYCQQKIIAELEAMLDGFNAGLKGQDPSFKYVMRPIIKSIEDRIEALSNELNKGVE